MKYTSSYLYSIARFAASLCMLIFFIKPAFSATVEHADIWTSMSYYKHLSGNKWNYFVNPQVRFIDNKYKLKQVNLYLALSYEVKDDTEVLLGVFRSYLQESNGQVSGENRIWQQLSTSLLGKSALDIASRSRLEERIMNGTNSYANRYRQLFSLEIPLVKQSILVIGNEFFLQLNKPSWVSQRTYAQNRFNIGIRRVKDGVSYEIGYLNQYLFNTTNAMSNVLYFNVAYSKQQSHTIRDILLDN